MPAPPPNSELSSSPNKSEGTGLDPEHIFSVKATDAATNQEVTLQYQAEAVSGHGSFGVVLKARLVGGGSGVVALKRTKQDRRYKNRELQIMLAVKHQNIVRLRYYYYEGSPKDEEVYLNLVLDHIPETIYKTYRGYIKRRQQFPELLIKLYMHQLFRALSYLHAAGVCHRDLKPHNILTDPETGVLTLIDFGSAKVLKPGEPNVSYTCSRYYRAPELIFGSTKYSEAIDLWSTGCILGEMLQGSVFFPGTSGIDQLVEIIKVLGTPTREQIKTMNPNYMEHKFPQIKPVPLTRLLPKASPEAISLLQGLLMFDPSARTSACEAMADPFFDEIKVQGKHLPNGMPLPALFNFSREELSIRPDLIRRLVPPHVEQQLYDSEQLDLSHFVPIDVATLWVEIE